MKIGTPTAIPIQMNAQWPSVDARRFNNGEPWASIEAVLDTTNGIPMISRARYLPVNIMGVEWWFKADLVSLELVHESVNESIQYLDGLIPVWDITLGIHAAIILRGNTTITMVNVTGGKSGNLTVINATAVYTLTFAGNTNKISPSVYKADNQVITSGLGLKDIFSYYYDDWTLNWNGTNGYKP